MSIKKNAARRALYSEAKKYLDIKSIFPKSEINWQRLTDYQAKKLSRELKYLYDAAGGNDQLHRKKNLERDFVKIRRASSAKKYITDSIMPNSSRGVLLPGGKKINTNVSIKNGVLFYQRGAAFQANFPIDATSEKTISNSLRQNAGYVNNAENLSYVGTSGGKINGVNVLQRNGKWARVAVGMTDGDDIENEPIDDIENVAVSLFIKYSAMSTGNELRQNGRIAAHPNKWGMVLIVEKKQ